MEALHGRNRVRAVKCDFKDAEDFFFPPLVARTSVLFVLQHRITLGKLRQCMTYFSEEKKKNHANLRRRKTGAWKQIAPREILDPVLTVKLLLVEAFMGRNVVAQPQRGG